MLSFKRAVMCAAVCAASVFLVSCGGLFSEPAYTPVYTYDIGFPSAELVQSASPLEIEQLTGDSSARFKMFFRRGSRIEQNEYRKWVQIPSAMLTKYLKLVFTADDRKPMYSLGGSLIAFEADPGQHLCRLYIDYAIREKADNSIVRSGILRIETPLPEGDEGEAFASAMSNAAADAAAAFDQIIKSLPQQKKK